MSQRILPFLALILLFLVNSCSFKQDTDKVGRCYSKSLSLMFAVDEQIEAYKSDPLNQDKQGKIRIEILDSINYLAKKIIEMSGGFQPSTGQLFDGCKELSSYINFFNEYARENIGSSYNSLDMKDNSSGHFINILNTNFFDDSPYFSMDYFANSKVFQLSNDLFTLQLSLVSE